MCYNCFNKFMLQTYQMCAIFISVPIVGLSALPKGEVCHLVVGLPHPDALIGQVTQANPVSDPKHKEAPKGGLKS